MSGDNFMGVIISPNLKRTREMIDPVGNIINPETKEVIKPNDVGYVPTKEEIEAQINAKPNEVLKVPANGVVEEIKEQSPIAAMIKQQIQEAVLSSVKEINIKEIVDEAIKEALK